MKILLFFSLLLSFTCSAETKLIILGSGTPNPNPERSASAYAVIVDETAYLIDFGPGVIRRAAALSTDWGGPFSSLNAANLEYALEILRELDLTLRRNSRISAKSLLINGFLEICSLNN